HPEQPGNWTDYRVSAYLRSSDGAIGLVFRYLDSDHYYRFAMDRRGRRLVRVTTGVHTIIGPDGTPAIVREVPSALATDDCVYPQNQEILITVEALGPSLRVYQDGALIFNVTDNNPITQGRIGLYCWRNTGARFSDLQIDDFRKQAPTVYHFNFTTSQ